MYYSVKPHKSQWEERALVFLFYSGRGITHPKSREVLWQPLGYQPEDSFHLSNLKTCILAHVFHTSWALEWICLNLQAAQTNGMYCVSPAQATEWILAVSSPNGSLRRWAGEHPAKSNHCSASPHGSETPTTVLGCTTGNCRIHSTFLNYITSKQSHS